jgi:hypothetical protein
MKKWNNIFENTYVIVTKRFKEEVNNLMQRKKEIPLAIKKE